MLPVGADASKLNVLDDLADVTPAGSNARLGESAERQLQYDIKYPYDMSHEKVSEGDRKLAEAMTMVADGPALAVLKEIYRHQDVLELVGVHSHIGSNIHDADAFIQAAKRMMLLRKTFYATDAYTCRRSTWAAAIPWPTPMARIPWISIRNLPALPMRSPP